MLTTNDESQQKQPGSTAKYSAAIILVIWRHRLNISVLQKPKFVRLIVVGPSELIVEENEIDAIHHVEGPITHRDQNHGALLQKVRELCSSIPHTVNYQLCVFERCLQREVAKIRQDMEIEGLCSEQFDQLVHRKDVRNVCKRGGLQTLRYCSIGSVQARPDAWIECANAQIGKYPMFLRPVNAETNCVHTLAIARNSDELRQWIKARPQSPNYSEVEYLVEECLEDGYEFISVASNKTGLIGTFCAVDSHQTLFMSMLAQGPYGIEYLSAEQTRDILPGAESFVMQTLRTLFARSGSGASMVFIKGFYRAHNAVTFLGGACDLRKRSLAKLFSWANSGRPWEVIAIQNLIATLSNPAVAESHYKNGQTIDAKNFAQNGQFYNFQNAQTVSNPKHFAMVNFPNIEGILLHQTTLSLRPGSGSQMRVVWRVAEGEEILDADGMDENVLQVFLSNSNRDELLSEVNDLIKRVEVPIDKFNILVGEKQQQNNRVVCKRDIFRASGTSGSSHQLIRSCTTAD